MSIEARVFGLQLGQWETVAAVPDVGGVGRTGWRAVRKMEGGQEAPALWSQEFHVITVRGP